MAATSTIRARASGRPTSGGARLRLRTADGVTTPLQVGDLIHRGGVAGSIHRVADDPDSALKLFHDRGDAAARKRKIAAMLANPPDLPPVAGDRRAIVQLSWPTALVEDGRGQCRGYRMPFVDLSEAAPLECLLQESARRRAGLADDYRLRVFAAYNIAAMVAALHGRGHHIIDLKPMNMSVYRRSMHVALVDSDGFSIQGPDGARHGAENYSDGYIAPEARRASPRDLGSEQDLFAMACILFQLLNNGLHPYQGAPRPGRGVPPDLQRRIFKGLYAYGQTECADQAPSPLSIHRWFDPRTATLFARAFSHPRGRPAAREWRDHLRFLIRDGGLKPCPDEDTHGHFGQGCGLCGVESDRRERRRELAARRRETALTGPAARTLRRRPQRRPGVLAPLPPPSPARIRAAHPGFVAPAPRPPGRRALNAFQRLMLDPLALLGYGFVLWLGFHLTRAILF